MTPEEILALPAGDAINALVSEHVMGRRRYRYKGGAEAHILPPEYAHAPSYQPCGPEVPLAAEQHFRLPDYSHDLGAAWALLLKAPDGPLQLCRAVLLAAADTTAAPPPPARPAPGWPARPA